MNHFHNPLKVASIPLNRFILSRPAFLQALSKSVYANCSLLETNIFAFR